MKARTILFSAVLSAVATHSASAQKWEQATTLSAGELVIYRYCVDRESFKTDANGLTQFDWIPVEGKETRGCASPQGRRGKFAVRCSQDFSGDIVLTEWKSEKWVDHKGEKNTFFHRITNYVCRNK